MSISMQDRLSMLQKVSRAWLDLSRTLDKLADAQLLRSNTVGVWSGKDLIAHIANWEQVAVETIEAFEAGEADAWPDDAYHSIIDEKNEEMLDPWRDKSIAEVRQYLNDVHFTLMNLAETSPHARPSIVIFLTQTHYAEHADDLAQLAKLPRS